MNRMNRERLRSTCSVRSIGAFSQDEISTVVGFVRWLRDLISKPGGAV